ncbi:MAG: SAM-dependent chlorinase/fluorinase [Flavobacteriales bacterium]|nr:SAM-dependent chlorinase/fluorinase [Flavobacteriales bacterium]
MRIITLTSDWGNRDYYAASVKGTIYKQYSEVNVVDITHNIDPFDILQAAFVLKNAYSQFPPGTIHMVAVHSHPGADVPHLALEYEGHYFIGTDNGIFSLILEQPATKVVELTISQDSDLMTFPAKELFVKAACHIARGGTLEMLGRPYTQMVQRTFLQPVTETNLIKGSVLYVDVYGNVITNIKRQDFKQVGKSRNFNMSFRRPGYDIQVIHKAYDEVPDGEKLALFGASGYLEIAINKGHAANLLGLRVGEIVRIDFAEEER